MTSSYAYSNSVSGFSEPDDDESQFAPSTSSVGRYFSDNDSQLEEEDLGYQILEDKLNLQQSDIPGEPYFVSLPNFLSIDCKPFDPQHYEAEEEPNEENLNESKTRMKLKLENTIRWRYAKDDKGNTVKESNAKIIRWSDESMSLCIGDEMFEMTAIPVEELNHIFVRESATLKAQAVFRHKFKFRVHSTEAMTHKRMTTTLSKKIVKKQLVQQVIVKEEEKNPELVKQELIKMEKVMLRAAIRRNTNQRRIRERAWPSGLSSSFLEGIDSGDESLDAIKNRYRYGEVSYDSEEESNDARRIEVAKIDSDESEEKAPITKSQNPVKHRIIEEDEDAPSTSAGV